MTKSFLHKQRHANWLRRQQKHISFLLPFFILLTSVIAVFASVAPTQAVTSSTLNFQGRLLTDNGSLVPDGSYTIEFKIYDDALAGTNLWTENRTGANTLDIQNGYFSAYLGSVTPFGASIPWDQELWMTMNVEGDGEMTPRFKLTAVPYAFRAGALVDASGNAKTADDFAQLSPANVQAINAAVAALRFNQTGSGGFVQFQNAGTDVFTIDNNGGATLGSNTTQGQINLRDGNGQQTTLQAGNSAIDLTFTLPTTSGTTGQCLKSDGTGVLSFADCGSGGGGIVSGKAFYATDIVGNINLNAGWTNITLDTEVVKDDAYTHAPDGSQITITEAGLYEVTYNISTFVSAGNNRSSSQAKIQVNGGGGFIDVPGSIGNMYNRQTGEGSTNASVTILRNFNAGDIVKLQARRVSGSDTVLTSPNSVGLTIKQSGGGGNPDAFVDGGNDFGATATLGTTGADGLDIVTNGVTAIGIDATGVATFNNGLIVNSGDISSAGGLTISSGGIGDLTLDSASDVLAIADATIRRSAAGTTTLDLLDASGTTELNLVNSDLSQVANLTVEGDITAAGFTGDGSGLTALDAGNLTTGTVLDGLLSSNVALLDGSNVFSNNTAFNGGLTVGNTALTNAGNIRFNGADFEGYDGTSWVSLTSGGAAASTAGDYISQTINANSNSLGTLYDVFEAANYGTFASTANAVNGFVFTQADGRFTAANDGVYTINATLNLESSANTLADIIVRVNGVDVYNEDIFVHSVVDPVERSVVIVRSLNANDFVELLVDGTTANITTNGGTTMTIVPVSSAGGLGGGGGGLSFEQNGNAFGSTAILGTTDENGLTIITNGVNALTFASTGEATFTNDLTINGGIDLSGDITSTSGLAVASGGFGDLTLTSASGLLVLNADTLQRSAAGTTTIDLLDAGGATTLAILNSDGSQTANLTVEGSINATDITAGTISGDGSGITNLNGTTILSGTIDDARLSSNMSRLNTAQTFSAEQTFSSGVVIGNSTSTAAGAIRYTGADFEGFNGTQWLSLTTPTSAPLLEGVLAFGKYNGNTSTTLNIDGATIVRNGTGDYRVTFDTPATTANYTILLTVDEPAATLDDTKITADTVSSIGFDVDVREGDNGATADTRIDRIWNFMVIDSEAVVGGGGGGGGTGLEFVQNGNAFGSTAILGTTDANGLRFVTDNAAALEIDTVGDITIFNGATVGGLLTLEGGLQLDTGTLNLVNNGITNAGSIAGATTVTSSGAVTGGSLVTAGNVSAGTVSSTGAITGATSGDTINGLVIDGGSLDAIAGFNQTSGNFSIAGGGTFSTGTGGVNLNGAVTAGSTVDVVDGLTVNGNNAIVNSRFYVEDNLTTGTTVIPGAGISDTSNFNADNDADEAKWTFVSDNGANGLNPSGTTRAWSHDTNDTPSADVGPTSGQEGNPDGYIYTEATVPAAAGDTFTMTYNTILDATAEDWAVEFYWNQRGDDNIATLDVQTNEASAGWVTRGSYGGGDQPTGAVQAWNFESLDLTTFISNPSTQIRFLVTLGSTGNVWNNDFALDTITVRNDPTPDSYIYGDNLIEAYNKSTADNVDLISLRSDVGSVGNVVFRVNSAGDVYSEGTSRIAQGADIAENYKNNDGAEPGDVVYFTDNRTVAKTTTEGQAALAGVISTKAAIVLDAGVDGVPVGLKGRLPTKVSIANGTIKRGDYLTSGPNGTAVKAVRSGTAIGIAMEQAESDTTIDVFVGLTYYVGATGEALPINGLTYVEDDDIATIESNGNSCEENCGYLQLATEMTTEDDSLNDVIAINKTGEQGNLIKLQRNGQAVFTVANTGALEIRSSSSSALDIRNVGGTSFFSVDTITGLTTAADITITGSFNGAGLSECSGEYESLQWSNGLFSCRSNAPKIMQLSQASGGDNLNTVSVPVAFDTEVKNTSGFTHSTSANTRIAIESPGWYRIDYGVGTQKESLESIQSLKCHARINGITAIDRSESYSVNRSETSLELTNSMSVLFEIIEADSYVEIVCDKNGAEGEVVTVADKSWLLIEKR